ncbi:tripartite motif-containing protein 16-like isoform X2 [Erpetoichthys calabaricus]|uniref:tripartite motif-containing protein 16-like isoform X2 n=1 Tax=Erpetoichthys calabaricus TaxID=27687 RepID=UPI002234C07F|nr:tripartite motif-containing protein 16-like isoform X2 [Erpetoichthys calabaricus]
MMEKAQLLGLQDEFTCSVCMDTLSDPVSIPCGHSFCLKCLTNYWDQSQLCSCPQCRENFTTRPELRRNTMLYEVIEKLKKSGYSDPLSQNYAGPEDVECDVCTGKKFRAVKSCLTCMASFCQTHLQPHCEGAAWKDHRLTDPDRNIKEKLCAQHQKSLEIYCRTDDMCICAKCVVTEHNGHKIVELETEREEKQKQLGTIVSDIYKRLEKKVKELEELRRVVEQMKNFMSLCVLPDDGDSPSFIVTADFYCEDLRKELSSLQKSVEKISQHNIMTSVPTDHGAPVFPLQPPEPQSRAAFLQYFIPLTMDPNTVNCYLRLCEKNKKVTWETTETEYPDHPDRFDYLSQVLCREALTGNRCYWEVECTGDYVSVGVSYQGLSRKGVGNECGLGNNDKSWCLSWVNSQYSVYHNNKETVISAPYSPRIGVYLDWPAGCLEFYSISHTMTLLQRFNTSFTEPLYLGFWLGCDSSVTICPLIACEF